MDLWFYHRVTYIDASTLIKSEKGSCLLLDLLLYVLYHMQSIVPNHDFFLGGNVLIILDRSFVELHNLLELVLLSFCSTQDDGSLQQVSDVKILNPYVAWLTWAFIYRPHLALAVSTWDVLLV